MTEPQQQPQQQKLSVLFVCLANICRSPMAEAGFRYTANESGYAGAFARIDSCGTSAYRLGESPDSRTVAVLKSHGIDTDHRARQVSPSDFEEFDYILAMDTANLNNLHRVAPPGSKAKVMLFGDFGKNKGEEVADPYFKGMAEFETNLRQIVGFSKDFLRQVVGAEGV